MKGIEMGGYYLEEGLKRYLEMKLEPSDIELLIMLNLIETKSKGAGVFELENLNVEDEQGPEKLTLYFEKGHYLLMLLDYDDDGYIEVRTPYNAFAPNTAMQHILGEPYGATTIIHDFEIVKKCFMEFNRVGNVTRAILY